MPFHFKHRLFPLKARIPKSKRMGFTTKDGNKNFYKGTGSANMGRHTSHGKYIIDYRKVRTYVVPPSLEECKLTPYMPNTLPPLRNNFQGYTGAKDGAWYIDKYKQYRMYGIDVPPGHERNELYVEKA
ncbi:mitochondrial 54S ribosomal protein mL41 [Lipomyces oligophaga]|uniref:mitochondrial 54S ribosomal protein mL41 n=1 Tax=Lipomyces oligophaga TaxID=45792 RepID=UPI0034CD3592